METVVDDLLAHSLDVIDRSTKANKPFFLLYNTTRMHVFTHLSPKWENKSGYGLFADGMMEFDWEIGEVLKRLDDLGIANNTIFVLISENGAETFSWPRTSNVPIVTNLWQDPFECFHEDLGEYETWWAVKLWTMVPAHSKS
jgi:arylsulfatase A-like enzyme